VAFAASAAQLAYACPDLPAIGPDRKPVLYQIVPARSSDLTKLDFGRFSVRVMV
jgi:hypothetical protein